MRRSRVALAGIALALALSACGGIGTASTTLRISTDNNCGGAYVLKSATAQVGTVCGGIVGYPPVRVALRPGERFEVIAARIIGTTRYPALQAHGSAISRASSHGASVTDIATRHGRATLTSTRYCEKPVNRECVAFAIFVS